MPEQDNRPPRKHWLDYFDIFAKVVLSIAAAIISYQGVNWNRDANNRNMDLLRSQTSNQVESLKLQEAISQRQVASGMMPYLTCRNPSSAMALQIIHLGAPVYETAVRDTMLACAHSNTEKAALTKLKENAEQHAKQIAFLQHVNFARQYLHVGSYQDAAVEYLAAYQNMPANYSGYIINEKKEKATQAEKALSDENFQEAAELFTSVFSKIPAPEAASQ